MALLTVSVGKPVGQDKGPIAGRSMIITPVTKVTFPIGGEKIDHSIIYAGTTAYCFFKKFYLMPYVKIYYIWIKTYFYK